MKEGPYYEVMRVYEVGLVDGSALVTLRAENDGSTLWEMALSMPPLLAPLKGALVDVVPPSIRVKVEVN